MTRHPKSRNQKFSDWVNQGLKKARWPVSRVARLGLLIGIAAAVAVLYLLQSSQIVTTTRHVQTLREELSQLQQDNAELMLDISAAGSVEQLKQRAQVLGFELAQKVVYLPVRFQPIDDAPSVRDAYLH